MKLIIDIPEEMYAQIINEDGIDTMLIPYKDIIKNGTVLPKGHGRLIDADELKKIIKENDALTMTGFSVRLCDINNTPTIIEADTAEREG